MRRERCALVWMLTLCHAVCLSVYAANEADPHAIVAGPQNYVGRSVTTNVRFVRRANVYRGWEGQAHLKPEKTIKFIADPFREIACYAEKTPHNEEILRKVRKGQPLTVTGTIEKCEPETRVKGARGTFKRRAQDVERYIFKIDKVEEGKRGDYRRGRGR